MTEYPNAKINLGLNILRKREDGYHDIETVFYPTALTDVLEINECPKALSDIEPHITGKTIPGDVTENLVFRVLKDLQDEFELPKMEFFLHKRIPLGAGLGGGSSDAAYAMRMANDMFRIGLDEAEMQQRMARYGADCAFFIKNEPVAASGIGDVFSPVSVSLKGKCLLIVKPRTFISTKEAYAGVRPCIPENSAAENVCRDIKEWKGLLKNDFEESVFRNHPEISSIKDTLYDMGASYASMSGSGSALYGIFERGILNVGGYRDGLNAAKIFTDCFVHQSLILR